MKKIIALAFACLLLPMQASAYYLKGSSTQVVNSTVTANLASTSYTIPSDFVGFAQESYNINSLSGIPHNPTFTAANTNLINLFKLLGGSGTLHLGGNSCDGSGGEGPAVPTPTIINNLGAFLSAVGTNWKLDYCLPLLTFNTATALTYAGYVVNGVTANNFYLHFGNEVDLYGISSSTYATEWNSYYTTINGTYPNLNYEAGEFSNPSNMNWANGFSNISLATTHNYAAAFPTSIAGALGQVAGIQSSASTVLNYAATNFGNIQKSRINEIAMGYDITSGTDPTRISSSLTASAWYLDVAINFAAAGGGGVSQLENLDTTFDLDVDAYIGHADGSYTAQGAFYGMMLFSQISGQQIVSSTVGGSGNIKALSTKNANGNANILVVNNDTVNAAVVKPDQSNAWNNALILSITPGNSKGCIDQTPLIGGAAIQGNGTWTGTPFSIQKGDTVTIAPCGAALIKIQQ